MSKITALTSSVQQLRDAIDNLKDEIGSLKEQLEAVMALPAPRPREITDTDAKREIKEYFESLDGDVIYPSEVSENLNIDYDQVTRLMQDLADNGEIAAS